MLSAAFYAIGGQRSHAKLVIPSCQILLRNLNQMLEAGPAVISSIMGLYPDHFVKQMKASGIKWFATATTVSEAKTAADAGADVIIAQGMEAGGHRGALMQQRRKRVWSAFLAYCPPLRMPSKSPWSRRKELAMGVGSLPLFC
jgi:hypothetical protein